MSDQPVCHRFLPLVLGVGVVLSVGLAGGDCRAGGNSPDEKISPPQRSAPATALPKRGSDGRIPIPVPQSFAKPAPMATPSAPSLPLPPPPRPEAEAEIPDPLNAPDRPRLAPLPVPRFQPRQAASETTAVPAQGNTPTEPVAAGQGTAPASAPASAAPASAASAGRNATAPALKGGNAEVAPAKNAAGKDGKGNGKNADSKNAEAKGEDAGATGAGKGGSRPSGGEARPQPLAREIAQPPAIVPPPHPAIPSVPPDRSYPIQFAAGISTIPDSAPLILDSVALRMHDNANARLEIRAFAEGDNDTAREARKLALIRGQTVREQLETRGIRIGRMDIRALGVTPSSGDKDRVELVLMY